VADRLFPNTMLRTSFILGALKELAVWSGEVGFFLSPLALS
jgi:hypothetical protein